MSKDKTGDDGQFDWSGLTAHNLRSFRQVAGS